MCEQSLLALRSWSYLSVASFSAVVVLQCSSWNITRIRSFLQATPQYLANPESLGDKWSPKETKWCECYTALRMWICGPESNSQASLLLVFLLQSFSFQRCSRWVFPRPCFIQSVETKEIFVFRKQISFLDFLIASVPCAVRHQWNAGWPSTQWL